MVPTSFHISWDLCSLDSPLLIGTNQRVYYIQIFTEEEGGEKVG